MTPSLYRENQVMLISFLVVISLAYILAKQEEARYGDNLSIMSGELGICLQGTHPELIEGSKHDSNLVKVIHDVKVNA